MTETNTGSGSGSKYTTIGAEAVEYDGYGSVELDDGELIVYDTDDERRWIQSDDWIGLEFMV